MSWKDRRRQGPAGTSASPPDPAVRRLQLAAEAEARRQEWVNFVAQHVLPAVNRTLNSPAMVEYAIGDLTVRGSRTRTKITQYDGGSAWVAPLLDALKYSPYDGYKVAFVGVYRTGAHYRSDSPARRTVALSTTDVAAAIKKFHEQHGGVNFVVEISL